MALIALNEHGLYCAAGDFYIDPWGAVDRAVITHAHSDHARRGSKAYFAHHDSYLLLKARLGADIELTTCGYGEGFTMNGVKVTLHPAGHILGSAQIRVEHQGEVWVVSGDYKLENDGITPPFEPVRCHTFITESTFGLPIYQWKPQAVITERIHQFIQNNQRLGRNTILTAYALGKSQRLIHALAGYGYPIYVHGATYNMHEVIRQFLPLPEVIHLKPDTPKEDVRQGVIIAPGSAIDSPWVKRWAPYAVGVCSGWMQVRGAQRRRNADAGFALSDHADWPALLEAVDATGASRVLATHGFSAQLSRYLTETRGLDADVLKTNYGEEEEEA